MLGKGCDGGVACKFHTMSERQADKLRENGFKLLDSSGAEIPEARGRVIADAIEVPDDLKMSLPKEHWTLNANNITEAMNTSPELRAGLKKVYNPKFAGFPTGCL